MKKNLAPRPQIAKQNSRHPAHLLTTLSACWKGKPMPDSIPVMQGWMKLYDTVTRKSC